MNALHPQPPIKFDHACINPPKKMVSCPAPYRRCYILGLKRGDTASPVIDLCGLANMDSTSAASTKLRTSNIQESLENPVNAGFFASLLESPASKFCSVRRLFHLEL